MSRFDDGSGFSGLEPSPFQVAHTQGADGERLLITFNSGELPTLDATKWLWMERTFCLEFAYAYCRANLTNGDDTRLMNFDYLSAGFVNWVREARAEGEIGSETFDKALLDEFDRWITKTNDDGTLARGAKSVLAHWRSALRGVLEEFQNGALAGTPAATVRLKRAPFAKHVGQSGHREAYEIEDFCRILVAIRKAAKASLASFEQRERLLSAGHRALLVDRKQGRSPFKFGDVMSKARLLASLQLRFGPVLPFAETIRSEAPELFDHIQDYGYRDIYTILHPSADDILPFVFQIAVLTGFNSQPLLHLKQGVGVRTVRSFGAERLVFTSYKNRADDTIMASYVDTDEEMSAPFIMRRVFAWTKDLRLAASEGIAEHVWLYVSGINAQDRAVRSLAKVYPKSRANLDYNNAVTAFCKRSSLPRVAISRIRATLAALAHDLYGGDLRAVMDFLQHANPETTLRNYTNGISINRHHEVIAVVQQLRERYLGSEGRIDPRKQSSQRDPSAATPGWLCLNPYDSPIAGERKGHLCQAYGQCPACPLAYIEHTSPTACARVTQVKGELERAKLRVLPERWTSSLMVLHGVIEAFWLPAFSDAVREQAARVHVSPIFPFE